MHVSVLGAVEVEVDGRPVDLGTRKQRALLAALALSRGRAVSVDALVDLIWDGTPPAGVSGTLQAYVAGLRRALEPDRAARATPTVLVTRSPGYALDIAADAVDVARFEAGIARSRALLGPLVHDIVPAATAAQPRASDIDEVRGLLTAVDRLWRGTPYLELADTASVVAERARLDDLHLASLELAAVARLADGDHAAVAAELEALTTAHPLRERLWSLRAVALTRAGRQGEALAVLRDVRTILADELGIDPGEGLRTLETAVLRQDPALGWRPPAAGREERTVGRSTGNGTRPRPGDNASANDAPAAPAADGQESPTAAGPRLPSPMHPWPLVGRRAALDSLVQLLDQAVNGVPQFASLVGEPGIGKSRLCAEIAAVARDRGAHVLIGRCSQDEGAPALWPWSAVMAGLPDAPSVYDLAGPAHPDQEDARGEHFYTWDTICRALLDASASGPILVILDDLHWADTSSLRVLRHLVSTAENGRLLVVTTWRAHPAPTGALAEAAEALARRHALRVDLHGLSTAEAGALLAAVAGAQPSARDADALRHRTDGNPFYLVEYARLVGQSADARAALDAHPPSAVTEVLSRRIEALPAGSLPVLRAAATLGRGFELGPLSVVADRSEDAVLDDLDPALAAGLVVEDGVDRFRFAHALVRDAVYAGLPLSRRARLHARAAEALAGQSTGNAPQSEIARHWLSAGPAYAARAWRSAADAAADARRVHAHEEVRELLLDALAAMRDDPAATWTDRYRVLMELANASRLAAHWTGLNEAVDEAIMIAEAAGDVECAAAAAVAPSEGALWQPRDHGVVQDRIVVALRRSLDALPAGDGVPRCRVMVALATELYYSTSPLEREALVDEALAMARRIGDPTLLLHTLQAAFVATWRPATMVARGRLADEAFEVATREGDERGVATAMTLQAVVRCELGEIPAMWPVLHAARERATTLRLPYLLIVLDALAVPWLSMAGRHAEAEEHFAELVAMTEHASLPQSGDGIAGAILLLRLYQGRGEEIRALLMQMAETSPLPMTASVAAVLLRLGRTADAAAYLEGRVIDLERDDWFAMLVWGLAAEVAVGLSRPELGAASYAKLAPYAGRVCIAGSGAAMGPVDIFLALGAAATGELTTAARHADRALALCEEWEIPLAAQLLRDQRDRHGF